MRKDDGDKVQIWTGYRECYYVSKEEYEANYKGAKQFKNLEPHKDKQIKDNETKNAIIKQINNLEKLDDEDTVKNVLPYDKKLAEEQDKELKRRLNKHKRPKVIETQIDITKLKTTQPHLYKDKLLRYVDGNIDDTYPIKVVKYKGELILINGNHRVAIAKLNSQKQVDGLIVDLDDRKSR